METDLFSRTTTRRGFLVGTGLAAVAAACSNGSGEPAGAGTTTTAPASGIQGGRISTDAYARDEPQRFAFGVLRTVEDGVEPVYGAPVSIGFEGPDGRRISPVTAAFHQRGLEGMEREGFYTTQPRFDVPGIWDAFLDVEGNEATFAVQVHQAPVMPAEGQEAIVAPSPTPEEPLGVDPICTRTPPCPLHEVSLDSALGEGRPVVVLFATPARCQSRWCGPVLEVLLDSLEPFGDDVRGVHVEIFKDLTSPDLVPTVVDWRLQTEPWLYGIDATGTIVTRLDGAFDGAEISELIETAVTA